MYAMERREHIETVLREEGRVVVVDLALRFDVTTETVRRDLDAMESEGRLRRVHGGAVAKERGSTREVPVFERTGQRADAKRAIALRALDAIPPGFSGSIYLDAGTTTAAIAAMLPERLAAFGSSAEVVTHSLTLAPIVAGVPNISLLLIGGRIRGVTAAAVGASTVRSIAAIRPDIAFIGANGISGEFGLSTPDAEEAAVKEAIVRAARRVVVLADSSKFGQELLVGFAALNEIDVIVSDAPMQTELADAVSAAGVEAWIA
ncbi:DeoR/GlpR family DNA-binding transcription regulator [Microbacterium halimionae]|nr:DeoR/GlpR family DNA-binding transcription regulator [Microbacterium halimionae]